MKARQNEIWLQLLVALIQKEGASDWTVPPKLAERADELLNEYNERFEVDNE